MGHVCANYISHKNLTPPFIGLIISGGHTYLINVKNFVDFELIGTTIDDAAGEAFDKVARAMDLPYPGGPVIDELAKTGKDNLNFPRVMINDGYNFSFSGLKTAVINYLHNKDQKNEKIIKEDVAKSFQEAVVDVLLEKTFKLQKEKGLDTIVLSGGVSANSRVREAFEERGKKEGVKIFYPSKDLCTDNAAMIGSCAYYLYNSKTYDGITFADPNLGL